MGSILPEEPSFFLEITDLGFCVALFFSVLFIFYVCTYTSPSKIPNWCLSRSCDRFLCPPINPPGQLHSDPVACACTYIAHECIHYVTVYIWKLDHIIHTFTVAQGPSFNTQLAFFSIPWWQDVCIMCILGCAPYIWNVCVSEQFIEAFHALHCSFMVYRKRLMCTLKY